MESCVLFANKDSSVVLIDVPRSIEEAQVLPAEVLERRIVSSPPSAAPWQTQGSEKKPKQPDSTRSTSVMIGELMTQGKVRAALEEINELYSGLWCLPRILATAKDQSESKSRKRKEPSTETGLNDNSDSPPYIPSDSHHLLGSIDSLRETFLETAPIFDLIILDPPWPSRSVRRKREIYRIANDMQEVEKLLSLVPVASHLNPDGLVAVWVTNKTAVLESLTSLGGMFDKWGLESVGQWIWVKMTSYGEPIIDIDSEWRKPWERLVIARRKGSHVKLPSEHKVIFGVPDLHSRKPNLRKLFETILPKKYRGLEVFARNLTAGWWSWGDQALLFQQHHHWLLQTNSEQTKAYQVATK